ncbi:ABC transporter permease [Aminipila terrae]|uniref:Transport permease protein n=1 Tax=Aminipila terrae TaxID=2697030 RepID=A0A6P1MM41_9FIRM|nr:ABC transporter permease [Aminipila terrae]QHI72065.1 ABC transporter permease [Aminipila terrae]
MLFKVVYKYRWLLQQLVARDLNVKYKRSYLGYLWSLLNPLLMMIVVSIIFSYIFRFDIDNFPIYLLCGQIPFNFFAESTGMAMQSITQSAGLINKVSLPKLIIPLSKVLSSFVNLLLALVAILIVIIATHTKIYWTILLFPIPIIYLFFICLGVGLFMSVLGTYFKDMFYLYSIFTQILMYFTPIFYPINAVPEQVQFFIKFNPMYHIANYFRDVVLYGNIPSLRDNVVCMAFAILAMGIGMYTFKKGEKDFLLYI